MSPGEARTAKAAARREQAAAWVAALTGCTVPHDSDAAFRASLRDGVTLCRLANVLRPGSVGRVSAGGVTSMCLGCMAGRLAGLAELHTLATPGL